MFLTLLSVSHHNDHRDGCEKDGFYKKKKNHILLNQTLQLDTPQNIMSPGFHLANSRLKDYKSAALNSPQSSDPDLNV